MASQPSKPRHRDDIKVAVICALPLEADLVLKLFDKNWGRDGIDLGKAPGDQNAYTLGAIGKHNVVLVHMPGMGTISSAAVSAGIRSSFTRIDMAFVVGICGAAPIHPGTGEAVRLGDCIISTVVIEYDFGKQCKDQFVRKSDIEDAHGRGNPTLRGFLNQLKVPSTRRDLADDVERTLKLLQATTPEAVHPKKTTLQPTAINPGLSRAAITPGGGHQPISEPQIHFGRFGSANTVVKSSGYRDQLSRQDKIVGFEMEGAGAWDNLPTIILKSVCDFADENKNDDYQPYAAATASAGLKAVLKYWSAADSTAAAFAVEINVPTLAVSHYVLRDSIQNELDQWLFDDSRQERMVLLGMGGAGKSQLALSCCRKATQSRRFGTVIWVDASTPSSVERSLALVLAEIDQGQTVSKDFKENLSSITRGLQRRRGPWLAVYDNYDTPRAFAPMPVTDYIPRAENGKVVFTSRHADSRRLGYSIEVSGMSKEESLEVLLKRPHRDEKEREIGFQIANELGHLALALDQAEAYIRARALPLEEFMKHYKNRKKVILEEIPHQWEYGLTAFTTWELSFEQLTGTEKEKKNKEHFLTLCAFFDLSSISIEYFETHCEDAGEEWLDILKSDSVWDEFRYHDLVAECRRLSLFQREESAENHSRSISLHPLIRDWLKLRRTQHDRVELSQEFAQVLSAQIMTIDLRAQEVVRRQRILSNINACLEEEPRFEDATRDNAILVVRAANRFAIVLVECGFYAKTEELLLSALASCREHFGDKDIKTLQTLHQLAGIYLIQNRFTQAEKLFLQLLADQEEQVAQPHFSTESTLTVLALVYRQQDREGDAEKLLLQILANHDQEHLIAKDANTLSAMQSLADIYVKQRKYDDAETLYLQALDSYRAQFGDQYPGIIKTLMSLALVYSGQSKHNDAVALSMLAIRKSREQFGDKHIDTLGAIEHLAVIFREAGRYDDAKKTNESVLAAYLEQLGYNHPNLISPIHNLARLLKARGEYDDAERLWLAALALSRKYLGDKYALTLNIIENLVVVYFHQERYKDAEHLQLEVIVSRTKQLGKEHPETSQAISNLAMNYMEQKRYENIDEAFEKASEMTMIHSEDDYPGVDAFELNEFSVDSIRSLIPPDSKGLQRIIATRWKPHESVPS